MDVLESMKRGYRALGLGADDDVLAMFDQIGEWSESWVMCEIGVYGRHVWLSDHVAVPVS